MSSSLQERVSCWRLAPESRVINARILKRIIVSVSVSLMGSGLCSAENVTELIGVSDRERAQYNWVMHCQGCHGADGKGSDGGAPSMEGIVSGFLHTKAGRGFLGRVPGVAFVNLPDHDIAELLNWLTQTFDRENIPKSFKPYSKEEVNALRKDPLVSKVFLVREEILGASNKTAISTSADSSSQP